MKNDAKKILFGAILWAGIQGAWAAKNIILFIGDGMGQGIVTATRIKYQKAPGQLHMDALPYTAVVKTYSHDSLVTDSAAAATAIGCGAKTLNDVLGQDSTAVAGRKDGRPVECISEIAKKKGKSVGLVTTTEITHATPAAFYAKINHRDLATEIGQQLLKSNFDLFLGGGKKYFDTSAMAKDPSLALKTNKEDLKSDKDSSDLGRKKIVGLFADKHLSYELTRPVESAEPSLVQMTFYAINLLKNNKKGFFLMVEGGRIDHALHANKTAEALREAHEFDKAIGYAIQHLNKSGLMKDTLVLVTADHETGGLSINGYPPHGVDVAQFPHTSYASGPGAEGKPPFALILPAGEDKSALHTGIDVTLFATGPGAQEVHGTWENTAIFELMKKHLK